MLRSAADATLGLELFILADALFIVVNPYGVVSESSRNNNRLRIGRHAVPLKVADLVLQPPTIDCQTVRVCTANQGAAPAVDARYELITTEGNIVDRSALPELEPAGQSCVQ